MTSLNLSELVLQKSNEVGECRNDNIVPIIRNIIGYCNIKSNILQVTYNINVSTRLLHYDSKHGDASYFYFHLQRFERYSDNLVNFVCIPCQHVGSTNE